MKIYKVIFLLILNFCLTEDDTCSTSFKEKMNTQCYNINKTSCRNDDNLGCYPIGCSKATDEDSCRYTLPENINNLKKYKCSWERIGTTSNYECKEVLKTCTDYNMVYDRTYPYGEDICTDLYAGENKECVLISKGQCVPRSKNCDAGGTETTGGSEYSCNRIELSDFKKKCVWDEYPTSTSPKTCHDVTKDCEDGKLFYGGGNICPDLRVTSGKKCIYFNGKCKESFSSCSDYTNQGEDACKTFDISDSVSGTTFNYINRPLNTAQNEYDYSQKCVWDKKNSVCTNGEIRCSDYNEDIYMCTNLKRKDQDILKCVYVADEDGNSKCIEKYPSCELYNSTETGKDRDSCENSLINEDSECEYILGNDQCKTKKIYSSCSEYDETGEKDRLICESIKTKNHPFYCVLDKDNHCIERELNCSEVFNEEDCLHIAKAGDPNKKCAWRGGKCYEEYIRCEDFIGISTNIDDLEEECNQIRLYNGLKCEYDKQSNKCTTKFKKCSEARTKEECKLIAKTGVSNPERKVCDFIDDGDKIFEYGECKEIFKYCSDYRGDNKDDCENIKPYDKDGENVEELYRCESEEINGGVKKCQKVPKYCKDGDDNPILCAKISDNIKDKSIKYCSYQENINGEKNKCFETYKTCESYKGISRSDEENDYDDKKTICESIIPENYDTPNCKYVVDIADNIIKCLPKDECSEFNSEENYKKYQQLCNKSPNCGYDTSSFTCKTVERSCEDIRFYIEPNQEDCSKIEVSKPYKICSLREDNSGCEEKYRELSFSTASSSYKEPPGSQSEESGLMVGGIHLMMIVLSLLF